jgi:hypothetical protein
MKKWILIIGLMVLVHNTARSQAKEVLQFATLSPTLLVVSSDIENYKKMHYTLSTVAYLSSYMITDSIWKSAAITLALGITKELVYDKLLGRGEPLWDDMMWNTLGTAQGMVFTVSLKF